MIRSWVNPTRIPVGRINNIIANDPAYGNGVPDIVDRGRRYGWAQLNITKQINVNDWMVRWVKRACKRDGKISNVIVHAFNEVPFHTDGTSRTTYLLPMKLCAGVMLFECNSEVALERNKVYTFNDHNIHGITTAGHGMNVALTVDFEARPTYIWR